MRFRKLLASLFAVAVAAVGLAQNPDGSFEDKFEDPPALYMGDCHLQPILGGGPTQNYMPTTLVFAVINSPYAWSLALYQDSFYLLGADGAYHLQNRPTPIGFNSLSAGSQNNTATRVDLLGFLGSWVWTAQHAAHPDYCTGVFRWQLKVSQSGVGTIYIREWTFTVGSNIQFNPNQFANGSDYSNGALNGSDGSGHPGGGGSTTGGGVGANDPTVTGQDNFWTNLFVPDHDHLDSIKLKLMQWSSWGPFGIYNAIAGKFNTNYSADPDAFKVHLYMPVVAWTTDGQISTAGTWTTGDLTPYSGMIGFIRLIIAGSMWMFAIFLVYKRFIAKAA
jgi:hypothetical protein